MAECSLNGLKTLCEKEKLLVTSNFSFSHSVFKRLVWEWVKQHCTIFFPSHWLLSHLTIVKTTDCGERGMNPVSLTAIDPRKEYWLSRGSNQRPPIHNIATLPSELWDSVNSMAKTDLLEFIFYHIPICQILSCNHDPFTTTVVCFLHPILD